MAGIRAGHAARHANMFCKSPIQLPGRPKGPLQKQTLAWHTPWANNQPWGVRKDTYTHTANMPAAWVLRLPSWSAPSGPIVDPRGVVGQEEEPVCRTACREQQLMRNLAKLLSEREDLTGEVSRQLKLDAATIQSLEALCEEAGTEVVTPTQAQLYQVALANALPYFGFGLLDNGIMIVCGDVIDATLCVSLGFSTMAAAALGNTISDVAGIFSGDVIEKMAEKRGFKQPRLTEEQLQLPITKRYKTAGSVVGIVTGCLVGMFPLLLMDHGHHDGNEAKDAKDGANGEAMTDLVQLTKLCLDGMASEPVVLEDW